MLNNLHSKYDKELLNYNHDRIIVPKDDSDEDNGDNKDSEDEKSDNQ